MTAREEMMRLSARLRLMDEPQDWGIVNGSDERLDEFMAFYSSEPLTSVERAAMAELLLASANDRLEADPQADLAHFEQLLPLIASDAGWALEYWRRLAGKHSLWLLGCATAGDHL